MGGCVVLVKQDNFRNLPRPQFQNFGPQLPQKVCVIFSIYSFSFFQVANQQHTLRIPKDWCHHFASRWLRLGLRWGGWSGMLPLLWLFFGLRLVVVNLCLVQSYKSIDKNLRDPHWKWLNCSSPISRVRSSVFLSGARAPIHRAETFVIFKVSRIISCTLDCEIFNVSAICHCVVLLSVIVISITSSGRSSVIWFFGRPERGSSSVLILPRLNSAAHFFTI